MEKNNENSNSELPTNSKISDERADNIMNTQESEQELLSQIKKIFESEFEELFPKILNLPKIDFLNQLTSNVSSILSDQFSPKFLENEKNISLLTSISHSFDKTYNKHMEELTNGWDQYNLEKINLIQDNSNEKIQSFYFNKFRKHCSKTQNFALHRCNTDGDIGHFIIVCSSNEKNKIKYLICNNCRTSYFIHEFENYCDYCSTNYLCGPLIKDENKNFLLATLNQPHCETFVNEELQCEKCKEKLYIDIPNNTLKCGNEKCDYCVSIENNKRIDFKCKICDKNYSTNVIIYNPIEIIHFKTIISKALLYKRKAYPGKLSCCSKIKEKRTDFYHKKDCKGNLYIAEYNQKVLIVCSKCKAVNHYSKFIWTCPECGIHFRDKKSQENEMKIRKAKSSNKLVKSTKAFQNFEENNFLTINNNGNKRSLADLLNIRKSINNTLFNNYEKMNNDRKKMKKVKFLSELKSYETEDLNEKNTSKNVNAQKKKKRNYIIGKILPWGTGVKQSLDNDDNNAKNSERTKEYYDKKVNDLINTQNISANNDVTKNEEKQRLCQSNRINYKNEAFKDIYNNNNDNSKNDNERENGQNSYNKKYNNLDNNKNNNEPFQRSNKNNDNVNNHNNQYQNLVEIDNSFNKKKSTHPQHLKKDNDLKCKKFVPVKLSYADKKEGETKPNNYSESNKNNNNENNNNNYHLFQSQRLKKVSQFELNSKKDNANSNKIIKFDNVNNKESWQSKETTAKGSIESKNSYFSRSPLKDEEEDPKKSNKNKIYLNNENYLDIQNVKIENGKNAENEDDIIPAEMVDPEEDIIIESKSLKEDKYLYNNIQRRLKKMLKKGRLPRFDFDKFSIDKQIGDGSFGIIYLVHNNKSKKKYAMKKIIANNINSLETFQKEFEIAHHNRHPSITDIKGINVKCFDSTTFVLYVLMDLAEKDWEVEINDRQKKRYFYQEKELMSILKQLSNALYFLQNEKHIAHRDVKPENVLIFKNKIKYGEPSYKLCDFGEAKDYEIIRNKKQKTLRGTELYMSPALYEGLLKDEAFVEHNAYKSDVFSLGCCMIIAASLDFDTIKEIRTLKDQIKIENFLRKKFLGKYSEKFIEIILKMINFNEKERIDFIQLEEIIESTF